jgi:hypothetical protein
VTSSPTKKDYYSYFLYCSGCSVSHIRNIIFGLFLCRVRQNKSNMSSSLLNNTVL